MTEQEQKRKAYYQLPISPPYCSLCPDTPFSLAAWGASPGAAPHLLSSPHSPSLTHLTAPGVPTSTGETASLALTVLAQLHTIYSGEGTN